MDVSETPLLYCNFICSMQPKKEKPGWLTLELLLVSGLFVAALLLFAFLANEVVLGKKDLFDTAVFRFFEPFATPALLNFAKGITFFGSSYFFLPAYSLLVLYFLYRRKRAYALDIALVGISSTLLLRLLKQLFRRQRPDQPVFEALTNYSFPSGHALSSFIFCSVLIYIVWNSSLKKGWKSLLSFLLFVFALCIGISRIVLRYHYASDVAAGFCIGVAWALLSLWLLKKIRRRTVQPEQQAIAD
jgi:membrane-associated phospholipid phosphatase